MKNTLTLLILTISCALNAGVVGDFSETHNLPGYIDLNPKGVAFRGPYTRNINYGDGVITQTPSELLSTYFVGGRIDTMKIQALIRELRILQENSRIAYCQSELAEDDKSQEGCRDKFPNAKFANKWNEKSINIAYNFAAELFQTAIEKSAVVTTENINTKTAQPFLEAFFDGLEVFQGVVQESSQLGRHGGLGLVIRKFQEAIRPVTITQNRTEAANLLRTDGSGGSVFYSPEELKALKDSGADLSLLDPPDSGFWRKPKNSIDAYDTTGYGGEELPYLKKQLSSSELEDLLKAETTIDVEYEVEPPKGTGETPKINVKYGKAEFKLKFTTDRSGLRPSLSVPNEAMKLGRGSEVNIETAVNNLAAALGFTVDGTYYKDVVRVFFENKVYEIGEFEKEYSKMYKLLSERWMAYNNTASALKAVKVDPVTARKYIEFRHVQLERRSDQSTDMNIGSFVRKGLGKSLKREHRAFTLFLAWVWDVDPKDYNNALKLVPYNKDGKLSYKVVMSNSDMGSSLASNKPNIFNFRLVKKVRKDANGDPEFLQLNYLKIFSTDLEEAMSFSDARWMGRLIGQLSETQIYQAFRSAGYSEVIAKYYTGIMLKKRNDLLDALNLIGNPYKKTWEFDGSLEGYEDFFRGGVLTDPENKLWDRSKEPFAPDWGAGLNTYAGEPQEQFIKLLKTQVLTMAGRMLYNGVISRANVTNEGLNFQEIPMSMSGGDGSCAGRCFFQGLNAGAQGFVPWRFLIENPDLESKKPFLIVDLFRIGFFAGTDLQQSFGLAIPEELSLRIGANHYHITEFFKVTPVDSLDDLFNDKNELLKMPKLAFKTARAQVIAGLKQDEYLIQTHYIGLRARARVTPNMTGTFPIAPSVTFRGDLFTANRVTLMGKDDSKLLVGWEKIKQATADARLNIEALQFIRIPVLEAQLRRLQTVNRTFEFDRSLPADLGVLEKNVNSIVPSEIPEQYVLQKRTVDRTESRTTRGFFNINRRTSFRRNIHVDFEDSVTDHVGTSSNYIREINRTGTTRKLGVHNSSYKIQASVNSKKEVFALIKLNGEFDNVTKFRFKKLLTHYTPMLPKNFIQFDPDSVLENFGNLKVEIETVFPEKGLGNIFSQDVDKVRFCLLYAEVNDHEWGDEDCREGATNLRFYKLWDDYKEVRAVFWDLIRTRDEGIPSAVDFRLRKVVNLLTDNRKFDDGIMNLFLSLAEDKNYYRRASMISALEAFPGQVGTISQDEGARGGYRPEPGMRGEDPEEEFMLFSDLLLKTMKTMFYADQYSRFI